MRSEVLHREVIETADKVFALSLHKYQVNKNTWYYTMKIVELERFDTFEEQLEAVTVTHEMSVFKRGLQSLPSVPEMVARLRAWYASEFAQQKLFVDID